MSMQLRCELAIPSGLRQGRLLVRLLQDDPDVLELVPAHGFADATHQLINAGSRPLLTHLSDQDPVVSGELQRQGF